MEVTRRRRRRRSIYVQRTATRINALEAADNAETFRICSTIFSFQFTSIEKRGVFESFLIIKFIQLKLARSSEWADYIVEKLLNFTQKSLRASLNLRNAISSIQLNILIEKFLLKSDFFLFYFMTVWWNFFPHRRATKSLFSIEYYCAPCHDKKNFPVYRERFFSR